MERNIEAEAVPKNSFYKITPCVIAGILSLFVIIYGYANLKVSGGWSILGVIIGVPFLAFVIFIDLIVKSVMKKKAGYVWIIETVIIILTVLVSRNYFF